MAESSLVFGPLPKAERSSRRPRHLLALSGGGFRGIFTAEVLNQLEAAGQGRLAQRFDLIAGTSIGGILAIGIGMGISAGDLVETMREHGPGIFTAQPLGLGGLLSARYRSDKLKRAIEAILGRNVARMAFKDVPAPLLVVAVDERASEPRLFRTDLASGGAGDPVTVLDVALATSAAPTFFAPHPIGDDDMFVDGGIIANAPDLTAIGEAMRLYGARMEEIHLCSIGTAGSTRVGAAGGAPGKYGWAMRHELVELIMDAQVALTARQVDQLSPASCLRIDRRPSRRISLDDVSDAARDELLMLANQAVEEVRSTQALAWRRIAAHIAER